MNPHGYKSKKVILSMYDQCEMKGPTLARRRCQWRQRQENHKPQPAPSKSKWGKQRPKLMESVPSAGCGGAAARSAVGVSIKINTTVTSSAAVRSTMLPTVRTDGNRKAGTNLRC